MVEAWRAVGTQDGWLVGSVIFASFFRPFCFNLHLPVLCLKQ